MADKPVSGTKEWAASNFNIQLGCEHDCRYCYAKSVAIRFNRATPETWKEERILPDKCAKNFGKRKGTIMFPTTNDITPGNLPNSLGVLKKMLLAGNDVLVVSKPHLDCIVSLCHNLTDHQDQILFRFTIGSGNDNVLAFWEPGAPGFSERLAALTYACKTGYKTSVSMEPILDTDEDDIVVLVEQLDPWVTDSIWLGKMNSVERRLKLNGEWNEATERMAAALMVSQTDYCIKKLYARLKDHPDVKWKESIKKVVGLEVPTEKGLDV